MEERLSHVEDLQTVSLSEDRADLCEWRRDLSHVEDLQTVSLSEDRADLCEWRRV